MKKLFKNFWIKNILFEVLILLVILVCLCYFGIKIVDFIIETKFNTNKILVSTFLIFLWTLILVLSFLFVTSSLDLNKDCNNNLLFLSNLDQKNKVNLEKRFRKLGYDFNKWNGKVLSKKTSKKSKYFINKNY